MSLVSHRFELRDKLLSLFRYINDYLSINDDCAVAHKLQGKIYENLMEKKNAFTAYCKSLEIDGTQKDLFEKSIFDYIQYNIEVKQPLINFYVDIYSLRFNG